MNAYLNGWKRYAVFRGRSTRFEYWIFTLVNGVVVWLLMGGYELSVIQAVLQQQMPEPGGGTGMLAALGQLFALAQLIPNLAVSVRRLHDIGHSGWWWWIALVPIAGWIVLLVWYCRHGTPGDNHYGPDPQAANGERDPADAESGPTQ